MPPLKHNLTGEVSPELEEVQKLRFNVANLIFETMAETKPKRGPIRSFLLGPKGVRSPEAVYEVEDLAPGHRVAAWLAADNAYRPEEVSLFTAEIDSFDKAYSEPELKLIALPLGQIAYSAASEILEPTSQLEYINDALATVELISLEQRSGKKPPRSFRPPSFES